VCLSVCPRPYVCQTRALLKIEKTTADIPIPYASGFLRPTPATFQFSGTVCSAIKAIIIIIIIIIIFVHLIADIPRDLTLLTTNIRHARQRYIQKG